jgi:hypothetical protein
MMGQQGPAHEQLFYAFSLESHVPADHRLLLRHPIGAAAVRGGAAALHGSGARHGRGPCGRYERLRTRAVREYLAALNESQATSANRTHGVDSTKRRIECVEATFALKPERLIGEMAYGTAAILAWMVEDKGIEPDAVRAPQANPATRPLASARTLRRL